MSMSFSASVGRVASAAASSAAAAAAAAGPAAAALAAVACISVVPILAVYALPLRALQEQQQGKPQGDEKGAGVHWLTVLVAFAAGALLGDAFLHLIPHALEHAHVHAPLTHPGLLVVAGIVLFFLAEKAARARHAAPGAAAHAHTHGHAHAHAHTHGHAPACAPPPASAERSADTPQRLYALRARAPRPAVLTPARPPQTLEGDASPAPANDTVGGGSAAGSSDATAERLRVGSALNIAADCAHNFTDGLAIAGAFLASPHAPALGLSTTLAVFLHEIPHEIGDYAILLRAGFSKTQALHVQLLTAAGAFAGALVGLLAGRFLDTAAERVLLPITAGGFIYIATVDVLPELLLRTHALQTALETAALVAGVAGMALVGLLEVHGGHGGCTNEDAHAHHH